MALKAMDIGMRCPVHGPEAGAATHGSADQKGWTCIEWVDNDFGRGSAPSVMCRALLVPFQRDEGSAPESIRNEREVKSDEIVRLRNALRSVRLHLSHPMMGSEHISLAKDAIDRALGDCPRRNTAPTPTI